MRRTIAWRQILGAVVAVGVTVGCSPESDALFGEGSGVTASGGTDQTGGVGTGGEATGGEATGGEESGGGPSGGLPSGGTATGGVATGGDATGGGETGGTPTGGTGAEGGIGGAAVGGEGGNAEGGLPAGGAGGAGGAEIGGGGGAETGGAETGGDGTGGVGACSAEEMTPCAGIPPFSGTQTVDGDEGDVCSLPTFRLNFDTDRGVVRVDHEGSDPRPEGAAVRLGWSSAGLHGFITMTDPALAPSGSSSDLGAIWNGDGVEVFFGSSASGLSGNSASDPVTHLQFAAAEGLAAVVKTTDGSAAHSAADASQFKTSIVSPGYTIEFLLPWPGSAPSSGSQIPFDFAINSADAEGGDGRDAQMMLSVTAVSSSKCGGDGGEPWCDDRTWCTPTLQ
ncbi:MAG: hypothetical protein JW751_21335 [Polyangiaceae bacterium]|nr:hypothetical protein [Polyangiaceae bacterium]